MFPLHHGDADPNAPWYQQFNDSDFGVFLSSFLHSVGALLFAAGMALYIYVGHVLRRSRQEGATPNIALLGYAHAFTLAGVALNGVGGVMRLYQSDHPGLERLGDSLWVQVLLVKHVFLAAGVGFAVWLTLRARRAFEAVREAQDPGPLQREGPRMVGFALASSFAILLATVLGAVAGNVDLAEDLGETPEDADPGGDAGEGGAGDVSLEPRVIDEYATGGTLTGTPAQAGTEEHRLRIHEGADQLVVLVRWGSSAARLNIVLEDPDGDEVTGDVSRTGTSVQVTHHSASLQTGLWVVQVRAEQGLNEAYTLQFKAIQSQNLGTVIDWKATVAAGGFHEVNLLQGMGERLVYDWRVPNSTATIYFDIHLHPDANTVLYPVRGEWNAKDGNYTHDGSTQGPSLLWENNGTEPLTVHYRVWGSYRVHSYAGASVTTLASVRG